MIEKDSRSWECGDGWREIIEPLIDMINEENKKHPDDEKIEILQIKEKFAGLRFYTNWATKEILEAIDKAEEDSYSICEKCGSKEHNGILCAFGWYYNCCCECAKKMVSGNERFNENLKSIVWREYGTKDTYKFDENYNLVKIENK